MTAAARCRLLLSEAWSLRFCDAAEMEASARRAVIAADAAHRLPPAEWAELRARSRAILGNALRIRSCYGAARRELMAARSMLLDAGDAFETRALLAEVASSFHDALGESLEAIQELGEALRCRRALGDDRRIALVHSRLGNAYRTAGAPLSAIEHLAIAIKGATETRDLVVATGNLAASLTDAGEPFVAAEMILPILARPTLSGSVGVLGGLRLAWVQGRIMCACGMPFAARNYLTETREGFATRGLMGDAALVSVDLAAAEWIAREPRLAYRAAHEAEVLLRSAGVLRQRLAARVLRHLSAAELAAGPALGWASTFATARFRAARPHRIT